MQPHPWCGVADQPTEMWNCGSRSRYKEVPHFHLRRGSYYTHPFFSPNRLHPPRHFHLLAHTMPSNNSQSKSHAQGSASHYTQASKLSEDQKTPSLISRAPASTVESHRAPKMSGDASSYAMQRWLQEKPTEQPWSASSCLAGHLGNPDSQDGKKAAEVSNKKE